MTARGVAFSPSSTTQNTSCGTSPTLMAATTLTDANNVDFVHNGNGELQYTGAKTKTFLGFINTSSERSPAGQNEFRISAFLDSGSGYNVISTTRKQRFLFTGGIPRAGGANYIVQLSTGDKVRCGVDNAFGGTRTFVSKSLDHFIVELDPTLNIGECHMSPNAQYDTGLTGGVWASPLVTTLTSGYNKAFTHIGNGALQYTGAPKLFDGYIQATVRKSSGSGFRTWYITGGVDTGSGAEEINESRQGRVDAAQVDPQAMWCKYTVTLNSGDIVMPRFKVSSGTTLKLFSLDHFLVERKTEVPAIPELPDSGLWDDWTLTTESGVNNNWEVNASLAGLETALFISNDGGISNSYTNIQSTVQYAYKDFDVPANATAVNLTYDWRGEMESGGYDFVVVLAAPTSFTPVGGGGWDDGYNVNGSDDRHDGQPVNWTSESIDIIGLAPAGSTVRICLVFRCDTNDGSDPAGAFDNVNIDYTLT